MAMSGFATGFILQGCVWKSWIPKPMRIFCMMAPYFVFMRLSAMMQSKETEVFFFTKPIPRSAAQKNF